MSDITLTPKSAVCPACRAVLADGAKFCHDCGARQSGVHRGAMASPALSQWRLFAGLAALIAMATGILFYAIGGQVRQPRTATVTAPATDVAASRPAAQPVGQDPQQIDLASMTPWEAADRLFNRVMAAEESGDAAQAKQFAPMTLDAYRRVEALDGDAQYHIGLVGLVLGNLDAVRTQIKILEKETPNHLLGLDLAYKVARVSGDTALLPKILAQFSAAVATEQSTLRPEYEAHRVTIEKLRVLAAEAAGGQATGGQAADGKAKP
ncbi:MAG: zinc ribbon domain-containing protein [Hyphomicrobiaceae bacterium]|nr:zinc ribbon domain-containing protein [Hyphomicrobiaceae bacterium]